MLVIGLTGGTGAGKGIVCKCFLKHNINSIDTDQVSRKVCEIGQPCLLELVDVFGHQILNSDNSLNRKKLADIVFSDKTKLATLNTVTHKHILDHTRKWLCEQKKQNKFAAIVDAPLLYESGFDSECDIIIAVIADKNIRSDRLVKRDNITPDHIQKRFDNQGDDRFYTQKADYVIENNGTLNELQAAVDLIYENLIKKDAQ